jgi:hypothetical protein
MPDTTFEEAKRHYECQELGVEVGTNKPEGAPYGTLVHIIECKNERCKGYQERWLVQTRPDGTVPTPGERGPKAFGGLPADDTNVAQNARDQLKMYAVWSEHPDWTAKQVIQYIDSH